MIDAASFRTDSSFLFLEDAHQPMHVGSVLVFEGSMDFESFRQTMASRVHLVPRLRQRLAMVPFGIGKPYWVDDPAFNLDGHSAARRASEPREAGKSSGDSPRESSACRSTGAGRFGR